MNLKKIKITSKGLYWGLIITFVILYACVGFVSTLHSITFFQLANTLPLAIMLGLTYEVGQASVLFSILMTKNKENFLPWALMLLLTALQVTANVYASFKFMIGTGSMDYQYWQKAILFGVQASTPEMYQVIISWISGALLPVVALGMTALVAQNIKLATEENEKEEHPDVVEKFLAHDFKTPVEIIHDYESNIEDEENTDVKTEPIKDEPPTQTEIDEVIENEVKKRMAEIPMESIVQKYNDLQKTIDAYKAESEMNPRTEMSEIISDGGISNEPVEELDYMDEDTTELTPEKIEINPSNDIKKLLTGDIRPESDDSIKISKTYNVKEIPEKINAEITEENVLDLPTLGIDAKVELEKELSQELKKDLIVEPPKKRRGRPPKQKDKVAEIKKEQELLPKEEVKVPQKQKRSVNPLKLKSKKIRPVKNLNEINKPSKGDEVIALLEKLDKAKVKESITPLPENNQDTQNSLLVPPELKDDYKSFIMNGVEVIDAKAIPVKKN